MHWSKSLNSFDYACQCRRGVRVRAEYTRDTHNRGRLLVVVIVVVLAILAILLLVVVVVVVVLAILAILLLVVVVVVVVVALAILLAPVEVAGFDIRKLANCLAVEVHTRTYL